MNNQAKLASKHRGFGLSHQNERNVMKNKTAVLEYCVAKRNGQRAKWAFRFKNADGDTLIESPQAFDSKLKAEGGFLSVLKSVASNQYKVEFPSSSKQCLHPASISARKPHRPLRVASSRRLVTPWN